MKTINLITIIFLVALSSCKSGVTTNDEKVNFGIYEVVTFKEIPKSIIDTLKSKDFRFENNSQLSIVGYIQNADSSILKLDLSKDEIKVVKTHNTVDKDNKFYAVVAIKPNPVIVNSDINKTKNNKNNVEIYFNLKGAKKWADLTKKNIGKTLAFIIDNQIYTMPLINTEIRNGVALINGLENEAISKDISKSLNSSISE